MNEVVADDRGYVAWSIARRLNSNEDATPEIVYTEELIAHLLKYGKQMAEKQAGAITIKDCVITIPAYFTLSQRR